MTTGLARVLMAHCREPTETPRLCRAHTGRQACSDPLAPRSGPRVAFVAEVAGMHVVGRRVHQREPINRSAT